MTKTNWEKISMAIDLACSLAIIVMALFCDTLPLLFFYLAGFSLGRITTRYLDGKENE